MSVVCILEVAIKQCLGTLVVTAVAFRDQSLAAGAALLPVFYTHFIETAAQLPSVYHDPYRGVEESVFDAC